MCVRACHACSGVGRRCFRRQSPPPPLSQYFRPWFEVHINVLIFRRKYCGRLLNHEPGYAEVVMHVSCTRVLSYAEVVMHVSCTGVVSYAEVVIHVSCTRVLSYAEVVIHVSCTRVLSYAEVVIHVSCTRVLSCLHT